MGGLHAEFANCSHKVAEAENDHGPRPFQLHRSGKEAKGRWSKEPQCYVESTETGTLQLHRIYV